MKEECINCQNQELCKWCPEMNKIKTEVDKIPLDKSASGVIRIIINCKYFQKKNQKQDGLSTQVRQY